MATANWYYCIVVDCLESSIIHGCVCTDFGNLGHETAGQQSGNITACPRRWRTAFLHQKKKAGKGSRRVGWYILDDTTLRSSVHIVGETEDK